MPESSLHFFVDFDGTITRVDTLQMVLDKFAEGDWRAIEDRVTAGTLSDQDSLQAEFDLVHVSYETAQNYLMSVVKIDESFPDFVDWCGKNNFNLTILSGGFSRIINSVLNHFLPKYNLEIFSSRVQVTENKWQVIPAGTPRINKLCNHCKTYHLQQARNGPAKLAYIGDGNTDRCPARVADMRFAKGPLAEYLRQEKIEYISYQSFSDIVDYFNYKAE